MLKCSVLHNELTLQFEQRYWQWQWAVCLVCQTASTGLMIGVWFTATDYHIIPEL